MEKMEKKKTTSSIKDGMWNYENHLQSWQTELHHQTEIYCCIRMTEENIRGWWQEYPKSWNTSVVFVLRGTRVLHQGTIYHSFGEINWWESEERAKAAVKKVREDCREEEKGVGWWERQLQGKKSELCSRTAVLLCGLRCYAALMRPFLPVACDSVSSPPSPAAPRPPDTRL